MMLVTLFIYWLIHLCWCVGYSVLLLIHLFILVCWLLCSSIDWSVYIDVTNISRVSDQNGVSLLYIMLEIHHSGREPSISRVPDQNGASQACYIVEIYPSGPEPSIWCWSCLSVCLTLNVLHHTIPQRLYSFWDERHAQLSVCFFIRFWWMWGFAFHPVHRSRNFLLSCSFSEQNSAIFCSVLTGTDFRYQEVKI